MVLFDCVMHCGNPGYNVELCIGKQKKTLKLGDSTQMGILIVVKLQFSASFNILITLL